MPQEMRLQTRHRRHVRWPHSSLTLPLLQQTLRQRRKLGRQWWMLQKALQQWLLLPVQPMMPGLLRQARHPSLSQVRNYDRWF